MKIGLAAPVDEEAAEAEGPGLMDMASKKAAQRVLDAFKADDAAALDAALKQHYAACE